MENMSMGDLLAKYDSTEKLYKGDIVEGVVISSNSDEVMVNIHYMADGILPKEELLEGNPLDFHEGQPIKVFILKMDDGDGNVVLSLRKAYEVIIWDEFQRIFDTQEVIKVKVKEAVKGGVVAVYKSFNVFIPASQLALSYVEDLTAYLGSTLDVVITEYQMDKKKVVASHKVIAKKALEGKKTDMIARISQGDVMSGTVIRLAEYGAFVDLGGVDGLIHISQMSWKRVKHPSEVLKEGDVVSVLVLSVDRDKEKISLKLTEVQENPWMDIESRYQVGDLVHGKVTRLMNFGAFVELEEGIEGLVHISELAEQHVNRPSEVVQIGDEVRAMILDIQPNDQKLSLSIKQAADIDDADYDLLTEDEAETPTTLSDLFGDKLKNLKF